MPRPSAPAIPRETLRWLPPAPQPDRGEQPGIPHLLNLSWSRRMGPGRPPRPGGGERGVGTGGSGRLLRRRGPESGPSLACEPPRRRPSTRLGSRAGERRLRAAALTGPSAPLSLPGPRFPPPRPAPGRPARPAPRHGGRMAAPSWRQRREASSAHHSAKISKYLRVRLFKQAWFLTYRSWRSHSVREAGWRRALSTAKALVPVARRGLPGRAELLQQSCASAVAQSCTWSNDSALRRGYSGWAAADNLAGYFTSSSSCKPLRCYQLKP